MKTYRFKNLLVWQFSVEIIKIVYAIIQTFPKSEQFALSDQLKRAVVSISLNIAEGSGAGSDPEFRRFLRMSKRSGYEVLAILEIAKELKFGDKNLIDTAINKIDEFSARITALEKTLYKK